MDHFPLQAPSKRRRLTNGELRPPEFQDGEINAYEHPPHAAKSEAQPKLFHKVKNQRSILALVIGDAKIYAGTQGGDILVSIYLAAVACRPY